MTVPHSFKRFGPLQYARIAMDPKTNRSRGTGFIHFYRAEDGKKVLDEAETLAKQGNVTTMVRSRRVCGLLRS